MKRRTIFCALSLCTLAVPIVARLGTAQGQILFMQKELGEWKYPEATVLSGGFGSNSGSSAGAVPHSYTLTSVNMTSKDDFEKVLNYYKEKTGIKAEGNTNPRITVGPALAYSRLSGDSGANAKVALDESTLRPAVKLRFFMTLDETSLVGIVVSRAKDEKETHIAITRYTAQ